MDIHYEINGTSFVWHARKAAGNPVKHDGITFEQAAAVFFDPFFALLEAGCNDEARDAIIGFDASSRLLFVVHIEVEGKFICIISARKATNEERRNYEHS
ncbi:MAG: BrnT family toxin [Proteobacteria bacterium]|nr:BrnT family toxin [Pseudomonadota bacterium]